VIKEKRLALGKELSEIAAVTRVRTGYLKAIEDEQYTELPIPVYARGYIRDYARALGVDPAAALAPYERFLAGPEKEAEVPVLPSLSDTADKRIPSPNVSAAPVEAQRVTLTAEREMQLAETTSGGRSLKLSLAFFAVLVLVGGVVLYQMYGSSSSPVAENPKPDVILKEPVVVKPPDEPVKPAETPAPTATPAAKAEPQPSAVPAPLPAVVPQSSATSTPKQTGTAKKHQLVLTAVDKVWVQIILDRTDKKEMLMNAGDTQRFDAHENVRLWIGNASGLKITFDGRDIAHGGKAGQSLRLVLPEVPAATPQPAPQKTAPNPQKTAQ
jgi:cytoskeleton protein RodZ